MELFILTIIFILVFVFGVGGRVSDSTHAAVDNAETQAGRVAAASGGSCLLILIFAAAMALLFAAAGETLTRLP